MKASILSSSILAISICSARTASLKNAFTSSEVSGSSTFKWSIEIRSRSACLKEFTGTLLVFPRQFAFASEGVNPKTVCESHFLALI